MSRGTAKTVEREPIQLVPTPPQAAPSYPDLAFLDRATVSIGGQLLTFKPGEILSRDRDRALYDRLSRELAGRLVPAADVRVCPKCGCAHT